MQAGLGRNDRRTIVGGRWEHDFDNTTTWRNQFVFDDRNINQPTGSTSAIGDFPSYNYMSDVTKRGEMFGMDSTTFVGGWYNTLTTSSDTCNVMPGGNATLGRLSEQPVQRHDQLRRPRARRTQADAVADRHRRDRLGDDAPERRQYGLRYTAPTGSRRPSQRHDGRPQFQNTAPELALLYRLGQRVAVPRPGRDRLWHAAGLATFSCCRAACPATTLSSRRKPIWATTSAPTGRRTRR